MRNTYIPLTCVLLWAGLSLPAQNPYIHHYTTQEGLPSNMVYYIYQDSRKFIWFATDAGVSRYDGTTFTNYRKKDGLASNEVIRIFTSYSYIPIRGSNSYHLTYRKEMVQSIERVYCARAPD